MSKPELDQCYHRIELLEQHCKSAASDYDSLAAKLDTAERELFASCLLNEHYKEALTWILADPHGCPFCDSGKLRNPAKDHDDRCGFAKAEDLIGEKP